MSASGSGGRIPSGFRLFQFARTLGENSPFGPITNALLLGITSSIVAVGLVVTNFIGAVGNFFTAPTFAFGGGLADIVTALLGGAAGILQTAARVTAISLFPGQSALVVPLFAFIYGIAIVGAGALVMARFLELESTSDLVPFSFTDFPFIGADEDEE